MAFFDKSSPGRRLCRIISRHIPVSGDVRRTTRRRAALVWSPETSRPVWGLQSCKRKVWHAGATSGSRRGCEASRGARARFSGTRDHRVSQSYIMRREARDERASRALRSSSFLFSSSFSSSSSPSSSSYFGSRPKATHIPISLFVLPTTARRSAPRKPDHYNVYLTCFLTGILFVSKIK